MRKLVTIGLVLAAALGLAACNPTQSMQDEFTFYTNAYRQQQNGSGLTPSNEARFMAQMAANRLRDEASPDSCGPLNHTDGQYLNDSLPGNAAGENIACNSPCNSQGVSNMINSLASSQAHRDVWLNPTYTHFGTGLACDTNGHVLYGAQVFHN